MRYQTVTLPLLLTLFALVACGQKDGPSASAGQQPEAKRADASPLVIKIGHAAPLSGPVAHNGKDSESGAELAIEDLNREGLKIGGRAAQFELASEDDAADPKQATAVAQKLIDEKVNGVVGHMNSGASIPASKLYNDAGIPEISPFSTNPKYTRQGYKTAFRILADDTRLGVALGGYTVNTLKAKNIAVIDDRTAYGQGMAEEFEKAVTTAGGTIVAHEFTTDKATDFSAILTKLKGVRPDVLFYGGMDATGGLMLRQAKQLGMNVKFMGGDGICTTQFVKLAGEAAVGDDSVYCAMAGGLDEAQEKSLDDLRRRFKAKFGTDMDVAAPYAYDAVRVLADAMVRADSSDPKKYLPEVGTTRINGVTGPIAFDERGDIKDGALTVFTYRSGERKPVAVIR